MLIATHVSTIALQISLHEKIAEQDMLIATHVSTIALQSQTILDMNLKTAQLEVDQQNLVNEWFNPQPEALHHLDRGLEHPKSDGVHQPTSDQVMKQPVKDKDEMAVAMQRERQKHDKTGIATMVNLVDKIALRYSPELARYNCNNPTNNLCLQDFFTNPDQLPVAVPLELLGIWTYAEEPTEKEKQMYDQYLARILPVPIYSPDLP